LIDPTGAGHIDGVRRVEWSEQTVVGSGGVELHARHAGDPDRPTVVLVHGYPDTSAVWDLVAAELIDHLHVVTYDVRGAGRSERPPVVADYGSEHLVADMAAVIDALAAGGPVHLVGHDWGSIQGWEAVAGDPPALGGRIASFTSISGPSLDHVASFMRSAPLRHRIRQVMRSWYVMALRVPGLAEGAWRLVIARRWPARLGRVEGVAPTDTHPAPTLLADGIAGLNLYRANVGGRLRTVRERPSPVPTLVLVPTRDAYVTPALAHWAVRVGGDQVQTREVAARHWVILSHPKLVAEAISDICGAGRPPTP
jgi:pimeloyl-ACP methyl ester carboxylesterase